MGQPSAAEFARTRVHGLDVPDHSVIEEVNIWDAKQIATLPNPF